MKYPPYFLIALFLCPFVSSSLCLPAARAADAVVAEVNKTSISVKELNDAISILPQPFQAKILQPENRKKFVDNYVTEKLLIAEARRRKLDQAPIYAKLIERTKNDILIALLQEKLRSELSLDEKDLKAYYESHKKDFTVPEKRRARHILVSDEKKAREILKRIQHGAKFESEARLNSVHRESAAQGGDLGWAARGDLQPEIAKVIFSMKAGELLDHPLRTRFGWHAIQLDAVTPESLAPYKDVQEEVRLRAAKEQGDGVIPDLVKRLKETSEIKIYDQYLQLLGPAKSSD